MRLLILLALLTGSLISKSQDYTMDTLNDINSKGQNYGIQEFGSKLYFISSRKHRMHASFYADSLRNTDILFKDSSSISFLPRTINSTLHEGPFTINKSNDTIVFSRSLKNNNESVSLFYSFREDTLKKWSKAIKIDIKLEASFFGHPHFGENGKFYFSSNSDDGFGGLDIYMADFKDGLVSSIENLGPKVNTESSEAYPFLCNGVLYYSSDRPSKYGGINIFSFLRNSNFGSIILDDPINTDADDFAYTTYSGGEYGYFSSNRQGKDEVFKYIYEYPEFDECVEQEEVYFCYDLEETTYQEADTLPLRFEWDLGGGIIKNGRSIYYCFPDTGHYDIKVSLIDTIQPDIRYDLASYSLDISKSIQIRMKAPDTLKVNYDFTFKPDFSQLPGYEVQEVFWDFDDGLIRTWNSTHSFLDPGTYYPSISALALNKESGEVEKFCTYKKIIVIDSSELELDLVMYEDFGYNQISLTEDSLENTYNLANEDLVFAVQIHESDTLFQYPLERFPHVEDKIYIRELHDERYSYEVLYTRVLLEGMQNTKDFRVVDSSSSIVSFDYKYYMNDSSFVSQFSFEDALLLFGELPEELKNQIIAADTSEPIATVYFDLNSSALDRIARDSVKRALDFLNEGQKFALYGYTDATGTNDMNDKLADERVESVYRELKRIGITHDDIVKRGYGSRYASLIKKDGKVVENQQDRKVEIRLIE